MVVVSAAVVVVVVVVVALRKRRVDRYEVQQVVGLRCGAADPITHQRSGPLANRHIAWLPCSLPLLRLLLLAEVRSWSKEMQ